MQVRQRPTRDNAALRSRVAQLERLLNASKQRQPQDGAHALADVQRSDAPWLSYRCRPGDGRPGLPPYGYRWSNSHLEPVEYEQKIIKLIRLARQPSPPSRWSTIAKTLNNHRFRTRRGNPFTAVGLPILWNRVIEQADEIAGQIKEVSSAAA